MFNHYFRLLMISPTQGSHQQYVLHHFGKLWLQTAWALFFVVKLWELNLWRSAYYLHVSMSMFDFNPYLSYHPLPLDGTANKVCISGAFWLWTWLIIHSLCQWVVAIVSILNNTNLHYIFIIIYPSPSTDAKTYLTARRLS